jgi:pimeloyl-ACP methyl ester carboxylesterase
MSRVFWIALAITTVGTTAAAQTPAPDAPFVRPPAPGQLVDIGGRRLHVLCTGSGPGPTVIFEAGLSQYSAHSTYTKAQDAIAPFARVCTYDRAGLGWSDAGPAGRTHRDMVADLHALLGAAHVKGPYVLVGHSMGGLLARLYASTYPQDVAGVVLLDATPDSIFSAANAASRAKTVAEIEAGLKKARPGVPVVPLPADTQPAVAMSLLPEILRAVKEEFEAIDLVPASLQAPGGYGNFGNRPLIVVRRGRTAQPPSESDLKWRQAQEGLLSLSTNSAMVVATQSGHVIPYDEPAVVADAVRRVLEACRSRNR